MNLHRLRQLTVDEQVALLFVGLFGLLLPSEQFAFGQRLEFVDQKLRAVAGNAGRREHFVMEWSKIIACEFHKQPQVLTSL